MKLIAVCQHLPEDRPVQLGVELGTPEHEGRMLIVMELCPECTPDFLPEQGVPLDEEERRELVDQLKAIWRGGPA